MALQGVRISAAKALNKLTWNDRISAELGWNRADELMKTQFADSYACFTERDTNYDWIDRFKYMNKRWQKSILNIRHDDSVSEELIIYQINPVWFNAFPISKYSIDIGIEIQYFVH